MATATAGAEIRDKAIALAVENQLLHAEETPAHQIKVVATEGIVTLAGRVDTLLAEQSAIERAQRVRGVLGVVDQLNVWTDARPDAEIEQDVRAALRSHPATEHFEVRARVQAGKVDLTGRVDSYAEKQLAMRAVKGIHGVAEIEDHITVIPDANRSDAEIAGEIAGLLEAEVELDDVSLDVFVEDGEARLVGQVATEWQKHLAHEKAMLAGATGTDLAAVDVDWDERDDRIQLGRYRDLSAEAVAENVKLALRFEPDMAGEQVGVAVRSGVAELTGDVRTLRSKEAAERVARFTTGVVGVRNRIRVVPGDDLADADILERVRAALARDAVVAKHEVITRVRNGHVHLYGLVDTEFEKQRAAWTASGQPGVVHVANYLNVPDEWIPKSDDAIREDLEEKLSWTLCCGSQTIDVRVEDGVAILSGEVGTWHEWQAAMDLALEAGARRPHNLLEVQFRPHPAAGDAYVPE